MYAPFIGEILSDLGLLTDEQVSAILDLQRESGEKFGEIAFRLGWVTAEQMWDAWVDQICYCRQFVEPQMIGIDAEAVQRVTVSTSHALEIIPLRIWNGNMLIATATELSPAVLHDLSEKTGCHIRVCRALPESIRYHLDRLDDLTVCTGVPASAPMFG